jgi:hypothetical protein
MSFPISDVKRRVVYSGSAGVGPYSFSFEILTATDIDVYKNSTLLTLTTDYTVAISPDGTGSVTLVAAATGSDNITLVGARAIERSTDFVTGGDLFANTLNEELDSVVIFAQQVDEKADRGLKAPITDPTDINMELPIKTSRRGKVLAFDEVSGDPVAGPDLSAVETVIAQSANINTVATNIGSVNTVAGNTTNINTVAGISGNVSTVAGIQANVTTVAGISSDVTAVAGNATNITAVAANATNINAVNANEANINAVNANEANINTVAGISADVTTVASIAADISAAAAIDATDLATVAAIAPDVTTVAGIAANVTTVANNDANITAVAGDATNIGIVAGLSTEITALGPIAADITAVAAIDSDVTAVAADATDIGTVASNIANVNTVAGISANVTTVAGIDANVTTVAGISADVTAVAGNNADVSTVAGISADVTAVAAVASDIPTVAANVADITNFADVYQGPKTADPSTRNDSSALQAGDLYFNTVDNAMKIYDGTAWFTAFIPSSGFVTIADAQTITGVKTFNEDIVGDITGNAATATTATDATNLTGTATSNIQTTALGSGTADSDTFLRGDRTWQPISVPDPIPSGTVMLFAQTAAPTGWTKNTSTGNNHALRVVTGTAGTGGTVDFTTAFASKAVTGTVSVSGSAGATTLTTPQIPSHSHPIIVRRGYGTGPLVSSAAPTASLPNTGTSETAGGGGSHTHPLSISSSSFSGNAIDMAVRYIDVIRATKD